MNYKIRIDKDGVIHVNAETYRCYFSGKLCSTHCTEVLILYKGDRVIVNRSNCGSWSCHISDFTDERNATPPEELAHEAIRDAKVEALIEEAKAACNQERIQIGGDHYTKHVIQPFDIVDEYNLDFWLGNALKYLLREKHDKIEDLKKCKHYIDEKIKRLEKNQCSGKVKQ